MDSQICSQVEALKNIFIELNAILRRCTTQLWLTNKSKKYITL